MKYSFKDILVGFRKEYLNIRTKLNKIEESVKILDQELSKCHALIDEDKNICLYFYSRKKEIIDAIINIKYHLGIPIYNLDNLTYDTNISSIYHLKNDLKHYHVVIENLKEFNDNLLNIFTSKYISNMNKLIFETINDNQVYTLNYSYNNLIQESNNKQINLSSVNYYPNKDLIKLDYLGILDNDILNQELNIEYDSNNFNDYQKEIIEKENKDIVLFDDKTSSRFFNIEEEEKRLVLIKR